VEAEVEEPLTVDVFGARPLLGPDPEVGLRHLPGSAGVIDREEDKRFRTSISVQDALRGQPSIHLRDEDAAGLVPNIGFRGLNPDRSERMLFLEDGVPAGLAPYTENAAYYVPPFERIARVEVVKGSGQILYGPHTAGAVLNLVTPEIPCCPSGHVRTLVGSHGYVMGYGEGGLTSGPWGFLASVLHREGDGFKDDSEFDLEDVTLKARHWFGGETTLTGKLNWYRQESNQTYLGLTSGLYDDDPFRNIAPFDELNVDWTSGQLTFRHAFSSRVRLLANLYYIEARRDWNRQDFARNTGFAPAPANTIATVGDPTVDGGAVYLRSSFGSRDRDFRTFGIEPRLLLDHCWGARSGALEVGARFHSERMVDERNNRTSLTADPVTRDRDVRTTHAWAAWVQERLSVTSALALTAGLRVEAYDVERRFTRQGGADVDLTGTSDHVEWIPGLGATYQLDPRHTLFAGIHRGFAPPRTSQAIDSAGDDVELDAEHSWNWEVGVRGRTCDWWTWSATGFHNVFTNLVVPDNESGGSSTADTNAGEAVFQGLELQSTVDLVSLLRGASCCRPVDRCAPRVWLDLSYTWTRTENVTPDGDFEGNELPYAPEHLASVGVRFEHPAGFDLGAFGHYTGEQFTDQANTSTPNAEGTRGIIGDRFVFDLTAGWRAPGSRFRVTGALRNVFDETYVASRAPEGIFPGAPRHWFLGLEVDL
jgi:Fe(3+) dicitrate transport protein